MNRLEFQQLATERLNDAEALLAAGRFACAYYISGYAVEFALKARIADKTKEDEFPPKDAQKYYVHSIEKLIEHAGLKDVFANEAKQDPEFNINWAVVKDWSETSRYTSHTESEAREIVAAISHPQHGVMQWLRRNW